MSCDEGCRAAVLGKTERTVGWEGDGEPIMMEIMRHCIEGNLQITDRLHLPLLSHSFTLDYVCAFQYWADAERFYEELSPRLEKFGLELNEEKTRIIPFDRHYPRGRARFEFLGFEFYWGKDRAGKAHLKRRTSRKKLRSSLKRFTEWCKKNRNVRLAGLFKRLNIKLRGYYNYYGVYGNSVSLKQFFENAMRILKKWLNRRSQRRSYNWIGFRTLIDHFQVERPRIVERSRKREVTSWA